MNTFKTILKYAKNDFNVDLKQVSYIGLQNSIVSLLKKHKISDLQEMKIDIEMRIQHLELFNIDTFMSARFGFYALVFAIVAIIFSNASLLNQFINMEIGEFIRLLTSFLVFILVSFRLISDKQKKDLMYLKFKLRCLDIILKQ